MIESFKIPSATFPTLTGSIVTFNSQYAGLPLKSHKVEVVATQSGSGTPSPDNVRPISGYSAIGVAHSNRNILPYTLEDIINANGGQSTWTDNQKTINGLTFTLNTDSDGKLTSITVKNTATYNTAFYLHSRFTSICFPASTLYSGVSSAVAGYSARISHSGGQIISSTTAAVAKKTYSNCDIILFFNAGNAFDITVSPRLILSGESDNSYVPHEGTYTTIQIGSTVYGGEYDARTGVLTVTHKYFDISHVEYYGTYGVDSANLYYCTIPNYNTEVIEPLAKASDNGNITSNIFSQTTGSTVQSMANNEVRTTSANVPERFYFRADSFTDVTDFNSFISNTPIQIVAKLATPTTIQLPPCPIDTLLGVNNIWANTGKTTLSYISI